MKNNASKYLGRLNKLIQYQSTQSQPEELEKSLSYVESLIDSNAVIKRYESNGKSSFVAIIGTKEYLKPTILLQGHVDVIEGEEKQFSPYIQSGKVFGRGAMDMKGGVIVLIEIFNHFAKQSNPPSLGIMITTDEEIGGSNGTGYLFRTIKYKPKFFITAEGETDYLLKVKQKGVLHLKISTKGKNAHASYTWLGDNAITKLIEAYKKIERLFPSKQREGHWYTTVNLGTIKGGQTVNAIPSYAEAKIDIRYTELDWKNGESILNAIKKTVGKDVKVEILVNGALMVTDTKDPYIVKLTKAIRKVLKTKKNLLFNNHGTNDARFAAEVGIPAVGFGPIGKNYHADNEYVDIESLEKYYQILKEFLLNLPK